MDEFDRRIEQVEHDNKLNHELLNEIKIMNINTTNQMKSIETKVDENNTDLKSLKKDFNEIKQKPGKLALKAWQVVLGAIGSGVLGYILAMLGLGG